ncbi:MAG: hypothetical protein HYX87_06910 [Chloroflexi bacterium]|nr:hypothetical protein [Chloroflexota bacterium]
MVYGKVSFLFEGDAQTDAEKSMLASSVNPAQATILKVGHHGSRTSSSPAFLAVVKPEVAVYSAGKGNTYGHPHSETIAALKAVGPRYMGQTSTAQWWSTQTARPTLYNQLEEARWRSCHCRL